MQRFLSHTAHRKDRCRKCPQKRQNRPGPAASPENGKSGKGNDFGPAAVVQSPPERPTRDPTALREPMHMTIEIKQMTFGELFDKGIRIFFEYFKPLFILVLVLAGPLQFAQIAIQNSLESQRSTDPDPSNNFATLWTSLLVVLLFSVLTSFANGVIARAIMDEVEEGRIRLTEVFQKVLRIFIPLVATLLLMMMSILLIAGVPCGIGMLFYGVLVAPGLGLLLAMLLVLGALIGTIYLTLVWALTPYAVVLEGFTYFDAMKRSRFLMRGYVGKYFLILLLLVTVASIFNMLFRQVPAWIGLTEDWQVLGWVLSAALQMIFTVYSAIVVTLFYIDLKVRKEGFDPAVMSGSSKNTVPNGSNGDAPGPPPLLP